MKAVIQRVSEASVHVEGELISQIGRGYMILLGVMQGDTEKEMKLLASKVVGLRIFSDENGKMNLSLPDIRGEILVVSQFTLCADVSHGRRPSFTKSAPAAQAEKLYEDFCAELSALGVEKVGHGIFGADMQVSLVNDGPVTILMNTDEWKK